MARRCVVCEKQTSTGNRVAHSNRKTRRVFLPNLQRVRIMLDGTPRRAYVCTRCLRSGKVARAL